MHPKVERQSNDEMARPAANLGVVFLLGFLAVGIATLYILREDLKPGPHSAAPVQQTTAEAKTAPPASEVVPQEAPPPDTVAATPAPAVVQPATPPPVSTPPPVDSANSFVARHEAAWGRACIGKLSLTPGYLIFECAGRTAIILPKDALRHDRNGVREIAGGRAYHFVVAGKSRAEMRALFEAWAGK